MKVIGFGAMKWHMRRSRFESCRLVARELDKRTVFCIDLDVATACVACCNFDAHSIGNIMTCSLISLYYAQCQSGGDRDCALLCSSSSTCIKFCIHTCIYCNMYRCHNSFFNCTIDLIVYGGCFEPNFHNRVHDIF